MPVCPGKRRAIPQERPIHDFEGDQTYSEKPGHNFPLNYTYARSARERDYDALVIPGGRAPEYLRLNESILIIVRLFRRGANKPDCGNLSRRSTPRSGGRACGQNMPGISGSGAGSKETRWRHVMSSLPAEKAHVDGNLVSAPAWPAHPSGWQNSWDYWGRRLSFKSKSKLKDYPFDRIRFTNLAIRSVAISIWSRAVAKQQRR